MRGRFVYAPDGRVLGEYGASASDVKAEFIWALPEAANDNAFGGDDGAGGYMPLAVATPGRSGGAIALNWVHGNHLGVPIVTTDAAGKAVTTRADYLAPGFPGQSRVLPDLYYNRHRDYDPTTGRYLQADPIGLDGGQNSYAYAGNNPIRFTDPMGLVVPAIPAIITGIGEGLASLCARFPAQCVATINLAGAACSAVISKITGEDCDAEWADAYAICKKELAKPYPNRRITGGYKDLQSCARGLVSQRCGGNRVTLINIPNLKQTQLSRTEDDMDVVWSNYAIRSSVT